MRVIIAGSRAFNDYQLLCETITNLQNDGLVIDEVVCGGAKGADELGVRWAKEFNVPIKYFLADWDQYGRFAGPKRNMDMGEYADYLIAFWDGISRGTKSMIEIMKRMNKHGRIIKFER